jgi:hypothetical protein
VKKTADMEKSVRNHMAFYAIRNPNLWHAYLNLKFLRACDHPVYGISQRNFYFQVTAELAVRCTPLLVAPLSRATTARA